MTQQLSSVADRRLASQAIKKITEGKKPTPEEQRALRRAERADEEKKRWEFYTSIPHAHWRAMSGRQSKVINEQALRHGIPFDGAKVNLPAVVKALHDFLARNRDKLERPAETPVEQQFKAEQLRKLRRENEREEGLTIEVEELREGHSLLAGMIRDLGENLQKRFGRDAGQMVDEMLQNFERECEQRWGRE
jgi:hypothetical protein